MIALLNYAMVGVLGFTYLYITYGILFKNQTNNFLSWILWCLLDVIALYGTMKQGSDPTLLVTFVAGTVLVSAVCLLKKQMYWTWVEMFTCVLFVICLAITQTGSPEMILWASGLAIFFAGVPYLNHLRISVVTKDTKKTAILFFIGMVLSLLIAILTKDSLIIPVICVLYWVAGVTIVFYPRKK